MGDAAQTSQYVDIKLKINPEKPQEEPWPIQVRVEITLQRRSPASTETALREINPIQDSFRFALDKNLQGEARLSDVLVGSNVAVQFMGLDGLGLAQKFFRVERSESSTSDTVSIQLEDSDLEKLKFKPMKDWKLDLKLIGTITRRATLVAPFQSPRAVDFAKCKLQISSLDWEASSWEDSGFSQVFDGVDVPHTVSISLTSAVPIQILGLNWMSARLSVDGSFQMSAVKSGAKGTLSAWTWILSGSTLKYPILGVVVENPPLDESTDQSRSLFLPALKETELVEEAVQEDAELSAKKNEENCNCPSKSLSRVPAIVSEAELAANPEVYTEDPGSFCKPFTNPVRILSERSFYSVIRTEQPVISIGASEKLKDPEDVDFKPSQKLLEATKPRPPTLRWARAGQAESGATIPRATVGSSTRAISPEESELEATGIHATHLSKGDVEEELLDAMNRGRREMDAQHPVQWDILGSRYQASTISRGHMLEFRVRTRSNGYSLGGVAKTLTLAPRQTKREYLVHLAIHVRPPNATGQESKKYNGLAPNSPRATNSSRLLTLSTTQPTTIRRTGTPSPPT